MQAFIGLARVAKDDCNEISHGSLRYFVFPAAAERFSATASLIFCTEARASARTFLTAVSNAVPVAFALWERFACVASRWLAASVNCLVTFPCSALMEAFADCATVLAFSVRAAMSAFVAPLLLAAASLIALCSSCADDR